MERSKADALARAIFQAGDSFGIRPIGDQTVEVLRVEAGLPLFGREVTENNLPQEIDRNEQAISFTKGCYIGQETVARLDAYGHVNKILRGLRLDGEELPEQGAEVIAKEKKIGDVASSVHSPHFGSAIATAVLRVAGVDPGTVVEVTLPSGRSTATVTTLPFQR